MTNPAHAQTRPFDYGTQADGMLANDDEIIPESNDRDDDDAFPDTLTGGLDVAVDPTEEDYAAAAERRLTRGEE